jgi:hypothetical protein
MENTTEIDELRDRIIQLQVQRDVEYALMMEEFESLNPRNIISQKLRELASNTEVSNALIISGSAIIAAFLSNKIIVGKGFHPIKQVLGLVFQMGVAAVVAKNTSTIKSTGKQIINRFLPK